MRVSACRDVRWMDVLLAQALTLDPNGRWTDYRALANDLGRGRRDLVLRTTMEHPNATRMRQTVGAFMAGDIPLLLDGFAENVVWYAPGGHAGERQTPGAGGRPAVLHDDERGVRRDPADRSR
jgi:hypothetical protein